ncbi:hypothetical protein AMATHDRAFT_2196 [Amanita thiersii Skay4041]|uniref:Sterol regulatory element-binding protein cleavage-activating protein n=1 Tax=Amanita thiersii Skay4041 TaxID=703135 RepID=A0A2A9NXH7_9AGAR|nr:hypothetical protein AMATHDRAFT_2196 [Amanita thiersii Skay4041]
MFSILHWSRLIGRRFFLRFGLHCATHQIRVILISCVIITSLFYPALSIYSTSLPGFLSLVGAFSAPNSASGFQDYSDLVNLWSGHDTLKLHEDAVSRVKCGAGRALRVEQLLIQNSRYEDTGALNRHLLLATLDLEDRLNQALTTGDNSCLKREDGRCFVISPLLFWKHNHDALRDDADVLKTFYGSHNVSIDEVSITPQMVLAGRAFSEDRANGHKQESATFLALTYFFPDSDCLSAAEHGSWKQTVHSVLSEDTDVDFQVHEPALIALEYDPSRSRNKTNSGLTAFVNLAYVGFFLYVAWSVRRMDAVHSRLGVTFTALVEIAVSTITSLSVCALVGFKITMVPWELLPIVIIFVGAENMFNLVDAVGKTSVTLSVKQRIAEGLSHAGTSNTLKVLSYMTILGLIGFFSLGAVRQFCVFAIVVLVAHWFLAHTFFMAVLSIDIQRLELEELLRHDSSLMPGGTQSRKMNDQAPASRWEKVVKTTQALLKGRATTNISLLMVCRKFIIHTELLTRTTQLLTITAALYYMTYSSSSSQYELPSRSPLNSGIARVKPQAVAGIVQHTLSWRIWRKLNPFEYPLLHLRVEKPGFITLLDSASAPSARDAVSTRPQFHRRTLHFILWLFKIMVLPIALTTSQLWFLLLYLLKDAELLEAQRNRAGPDSPKLDKEGSVLERQVSMSALPRTFTSDIELVASSGNGETVLYMGLNNELILWRAADSLLIPIDTEDVLGSAGMETSPRPRITAIAIDQMGDFIAVGTSTGMLAIWELGLSAPSLLSSQSASAGVSDLRFTSPLVPPFEKPPMATDSNASHHSRSHDPTLVAALENGSLAKWTLQRESTRTWLYPKHTARVFKATLLTVAPNDDLVAAFFFDDGYIELIDVQETQQALLHDCCIQVGSLNDIVTELHICHVKPRGTLKLVAVITTKSGKIALWDLTSREHICNVAYAPAGGGIITHLRVVPVLREACHLCGHIQAPCLSVGFSVGEVMQIYQLLLYDQIRHCSCSSNFLRHSSSQESIGGHLSRADGNTATATPAAPQSSRTPPSLRSRLSKTFEADAFPVSAHGINPRRTSETGRRSSEILMVPFPGEDYESIHILGANVTKLTTHGAPSSSVWRNHLMTHVFDIPCERGAWGVCSRRFIGIRRRERERAAKQRSTTVSKDSGVSEALKVLPVSTLERWELWTFDPTLFSFLSAPLSSFAEKLSEVAAAPVQPQSVEASSLSVSSSTPRMPFTRVSPLLVLPSHAFVGFGNTLGIFILSDLELHRT